MPGWLTQLLYLVSSVLFIIGLKWLNSPATARKGNLTSLGGMLLAMAITLLNPAIRSFWVLLAGVAVGTALGLWQAYSVKMTGMPQMVALLNGWGGGASMIVGAAEFVRAYQLNAMIPTPIGVVMQLSLFVGAVTLTGSLIAFSKLQEILPGRPITLPGHNYLNAALFFVIVAIAVWQISTEVPLLLPFFLLCALALVMGVMLVIPIGGADMPVVISLLNSYSGIAAGMTGFVINNDVLIIAGALVGSSGIILSQIMCKAMNRSLTNVLFGAFGATAATAGAKSAAGLTVKSIAPEDLAVQVAYAQKMIVVPGYGMAVAQAQHQVRELADLVEKRGGTVKYAIHPVAGRMPGHMNVLLAEANVPYDRLYEMDEINPEFDETDVCLVIGANDVVNPAARHDTSSPIYGMPIINADKAKMCVVLKRSMAAGFAGIENELFYEPRTWMLFGDAKQSLQKLISEVKQA
jgi:NAD(P) transhydrogenase subunit beta